MRNAVAAIELSRETSHSSVMSSYAFRRDRRDFAICRFCWHACLLAHCLGPLRRRRADQSKRDLTPATGQ